MEVAVSAQTSSANPPVENRAAPRFAAAAVPSVTNLRLSPHGTDATLVNISATGLLAECPMRLKVGSAVTVSFEGTFQPSAAAGRVVRCAVAAMGKGGSLLYHVGIGFNASIPLDAVVGAPEPVAAAAESAPAHAAVCNRW